MLESEIKKLTSAVTELTAAINAGISVPRSATAAPTTPASADAQETPTPAPVATPEPAPQPGATAGPPPVPEAPAAEVKAPTKKQLVEKFIELAQEKDREVAVKLLADYGVAKLPELTDKTKWAPFMADVDALLA